MGRRGQDCSLKKDGENGGDDELAVFESLVWFRDKKQDSLVPSEDMDQNQRYRAPSRGIGRNVTLLLLLRYIMDNLFGKAVKNKKKCSVSCTSVKVSCIRRYMQCSLRMQGQKGFDTRSCSATHHLNVASYTLSHCQIDP